MEWREQPLSRSIAQIRVQPDSAAQCSAVFCSTSHSCGLAPRSSRNLQGGNNAVKRRRGSAWQYV